MYFRASSPVLRWIVAMLSFVGGKLSLRLGGSLALAVVALFAFNFSQLPRTEADEKQPSADAKKVELTDGTWADVEKLVEESQGKVVIVDVWSTSCLPCMTEFPKLVKLHAEHPEKLVCVSFNVDFVGIKNKPASFYRERVQKFLTEKNAAFRNYLSTMEADKVFASLKLSSIPAVYVFGTDGKLAKRFDDSLLEDGEEEAFSYEKDINPFVAELLKK